MVSQQHTYLFVVTLIHWPVYLVYALGGKVGEHYDSLPAYGRMKLHVYDRNEKSVRKWLKQRFAVFRVLDTAKTVIHESPYIVDRIVRIKVSRTHRIKNVVRR